VNVPVAAVTHRAPSAGGPDRRTHELEVGLDHPLPESLAVGEGTAVFVAGWCFGRRARVRSLALLVDGDVQKPMGQGMPRSDVLDAFDADDEAVHAYRSGFWGLAQVVPRPNAEPCRLALRATLDDGREVNVELGRIPTTGLPSPEEVAEPEPSTGPFVAICMATYEPEVEMFTRQVDSIRAQTHRDWVCVISDDCSSPDRLAEMRRVLAGDQRFVLTRSPARLGFYGNFERALSLAPRSAEFVAMADQDDHWHPDKLGTLLAGIGEAQLVYSDARVVRPGGEVVADTWWSRRRNNHTDLFSLLMANCVTGAASLFRRELLDTALPFPPGQFSHFHDHWVGLTALALGDIAFVDRPLYDYVQHGEAVLGHAAANQITGFSERIDSLRSLPRNARERVGRWRMRYFVDNCRLLQFAAILEMRCGERMARPKRRALERFVRAERSPFALAGFVPRMVGEQVGRPETVGAELGLPLAFAWRHLLAASAGGVERPRRRLRIDSRPPPSLLPKPGRTQPVIPAVGAVAAKVAPLELAIRDDAPPRVNLLIPTIDLEHFFGGYIGKLNLAMRLAGRGEQVRIVTVDPVGPLPSSWRQRLEAYSGLDGLFERVEVAFGRESAGIEVSRSDRFVATTWWTAHVANEAVRRLGAERFLYLIQEYEPFTFPMGTYAALAEGSYRFPHTALFSTELLRDWFRRRGIGVYAEGEAAGDARSAVFENAITAVEPPTAQELAGRGTRRLLFYARPEPHAARNMFELGMLALERAVLEGAFMGWELYGIGTVDTGRRLALGHGMSLELVPRREQRAYAELLRAHDVGLSLMYTPHPSLVPIEMAAAGMLAVTNSFENKTADAMAAISRNLITVEPTLPGVVAGLKRATERVDDVDARARGARVRWSRDWDDSFDDPLMARVEELLGLG
jgi:glycosyltransferase involved in cell wall biosynthesis